MKIFICEQDPYRAKLYHDVLGVYNYKLITVKKHCDLFKEAYNQKPALIVMNETFAQKSGSDMLARLRTDPLTARVPVIFIKTDDAVNYAPSNTPFDDMIQFVREPIKIKNLRHYIDRWTTFRSINLRH